jgi:hypothetical protein
MKHKSTLQQQPFPDNLPFFARLIHPYEDHLAITPQHRKLLKEECRPSLAGSIITIFLGILALLMVLFGGFLVMASLFVLLRDAFLGLF